MVRLCFILLLTALVGCTDVKHSASADSSDSGNSGQSVAPPPQAIDVENASSSDCPAGGKVYSVYSDANSNGVFDSGEHVLSSQIVCNGQNGVAGANGFNTLFSLNRVSTGFAACASGSGIQVNSGLDADRSGILDPSEISSAQILCDGVAGSSGANGSVGSAGPAGVNGHSMVFQSVAASAAICPAGGSVILMALDQNDSGVYNVDDPAQASVTLCNGQNGADGQNGTNGQNGADAPIPAYSPVEPIMPCGNTVAYKEVLLRLENGQVLASFSQDASGLNTRLSFLPDGTFVDTDSSACVFSLSTSGDGLSRSISWSGQVQMSWPVSP